MASVLPGCAVASGKGTLQPRYHTRTHLLSAAKARVRVFGFGPIVVGTLGSRPLKTQIGAGLRCAAAAGSPWWLASPIAAAWPISRSAYNCRWAGSDGDAVFVAADHGRGCMGENARCQSPSRPRPLQEPQQHAIRL